MKKYFIYIIGIQLLAIGIICNMRTGLGVASFASVYYAISMIADMSLGTASIVLYMMLIIIQCILLKKISLPILLEIPFSFVFGWITDFYNWIIPIFNIPFLAQFCLFVIALIFISLGTYLMIQCNIVATPVDGIVKTVSDVFSIQFAYVKNSFDILMVCMTVGMCLLLNQPIYGVGIGTILSALMIGRLLTLYTKKVTDL